jgi:alanine racemase
VRPEIALDGAVLRANAAAFAALGAPVAAVVKLDGYGWGARRLARELDAVVESYVVADEDELAALRPATAKPIRLLADAAPGRLAQVLALGGIPSVSSPAALAEAVAAAAARGGLTVRVGVLDAAGWNTIRPGDAAALADAMAGTRLAVELWTHLTSSERGGAILDGFMAARRAFEAAGVRVVSTDVASTAAARRGLAFDRLRVGVGLFGARLGASVDNRCALRVTAPVVRRFAPGEAGWAGYGDARIAPDLSVAVLRCGYGDGFPKNLADGVDILSVGMQYTARVMHDGADARVLVGGADDVDTLAARSGLTPHELVLGFACR